MSERATALSEAAVDALLSEQFPSLTAGATRWLGAGEDFQVFERAGIAFRFPRRSETAAWLETEIRVLSKLGERLGATLPHYLHIGRPSPHFPFLFGGYPRLSGTPASLGHASPRLAADLGALLRILHASDPQPLAVPDRSHFWAPGPHLAAVRSEVTPSLPALPVALRDRCAAFLDSADLPGEAVSVRLIHGDLEAEHLLVDPSGALTGVLDWSDVCLGDPARDLGGLWAWGGDAFLSELLRHYDPPNDPQFLPRVRFLGRCFALLDYHEAQAEDEPARNFALHQLANAFQ